MDKTDWKILQILDWEGRTPVSKIAKGIRSNKDVVAYRIKKLEQQGIIVRYYPVIDMYKLGYHTSRIYLDLEEFEEEEFLAFLDKDIQAGLIFRMDYPYRYGIFLWTKTVEEVEQTIVKVKKYLGEKLLRYNYSLICTFRQYPKDYLFGNDHHMTYRSLEPLPKEEYDKDDFRILKILAEDARASTVEIGRKLQIPQSTVSHKIKQLEKKEILQGYRTEINFTKLGYMNYFLEIYLGDNENLKKIEAWADQNRNVVWLQKIIGTCDIEIEVEVHNRVALEALLNELRERFPNIRKIVFWSQEYKKLTFLP